MTEKSPTSHLFACVAMSLMLIMVCRRGGFIIQRNNELRDLETDMLSMVYNDVEIEPVLQELTGESLPSGANRAPNARLDIHARGFWERQRSAFFDVRVCYPNADSYSGPTLGPLVALSHPKSPKVALSHLKSP